MIHDVVEAAFYARVSSQSQADEQTIASQCKALLERIEHDKAAFVDERAFCDDGYSGSELLRPALEKMRDAIAAGLIDRVFVLSADRLARKLAHQALLLEEFARHECEVVFLDHEGLPDGPESNLLVQMQGVIAEYEREKILERTRRGRRYAAAGGRVSVFGGAPYGYRYVTKAEGDGRARWEVDPVESEHVKLMFDLVGRLGMSLGAVSRELAGRSIRTRTGKPEWDRATIRGILVNPAYYGRARFGKTRMAPGKTGERAKRGDPPAPRRPRVGVPTDPSEQIVVSVPPLIDESLFQRVAQQMEENRKRQRRRPAGKFLLSGLLTCAECSSAYCARSQGGRPHFYYRCLGTDAYRRGGKAICTNKAIRGVELEAVVWNELTRPIFRDLSFFRV